MERVQQWWRMRFSYKNATILVCLFNIATLLFLLFHSSDRKLAAGQHYSDEVRMRYIKESEEIRRSMEPIKLIKRVREISRESYEEPEQDQEKDAKQTAAVGLISRLNNFRANGDTSSLRALEEWRKRKIEREKKRGNVENTTTD